MPCEKERKTGKDPQPGGVLRARPFWQACVLRYRRRQPAARQEPSVSGENKPGVAINEAVELTKKYGAGEDYQFVNGLLGAVARDHGLSDEAVTESAEQ